ncbi:MAG: V-type ATP synthase subunit I [Oscillospiraceae bacterium]|nr:V-type ATP synthase subunit I [Oscillospiraceae bacterium]
MAIVKMKRLRLVGMQADRDALLRRLMALGCVELTTLPPTEPGMIRLETQLHEQRERSARLSQALAVLKKYAPEKGGLFAEKDLVSREVLFGDEVIAPAMALADDLITKEERIGRLHTIIGHVEADQALLDPWKALDIPLDTQGTEHMAIIFGTVPPLTELDQVETMLAQATPESALYKVGESRTGHCLMVVCHRSVQSNVMNILRQVSFQAVSFDQTDTAPASISALTREQQEATAELAEIKEEIKILSYRRAELKLCADRLAQEVTLEEAKEKLQDTASTFALEGWFSAPQEPELAAVLDAFGCTWEQSDPTPAEFNQVPVKLKGNKITEPLNMVTEMYGLPAYDGIDPNGLIMPFFAIFFGLMYADLGYGLILLFISLFLRRKRLSRGMKNAANLLFQVSITTAIFGAIFGGFFGDVIPVFSETFLSQRVDMWALIDPMSDPLLLMVGAMILGAIQILVGMCVKIYICFRDGRPLDALCDVVTWWVLFGGIAMLALGHGAWLAIIGAVSVVLAAGRRNKSVFGKLFGGVGSLYRITNYLSDILSYLRLMALFLATSVIASVFNILGSLLGGGIIGFIGFVVIFLIGHGFNMGINIIGTYVHAIRLQYLEFFGQFYKEGGRPFKPLAFSTKYYDITE